MALSPDDPVVAIDPKLATRRMGRSKGPEAHIVLADALGIETVGQLLHHYPRRYIDRSLVLPIGQLKIDAFATVIATVRSVKKRQTRRRQTMVTVTIGDGTGFLDLTFFNQPWTASLYREGVEVAVSGTVQLYRHRLQLGSQEIEVLRSDDQDLVHTGRITPVHRASEGISPRTIRELVWRALEQLPPLADPIPADVREAEALTDRDRGAALDPLPGRPGGAGDRARATEVRRAVHPGARGRVPPAPARRRALRDRARHHGTPARRVRPVVAVHADRRPAPRDRGGRPSDGGAPADEPAPAG